MTGDFISRLLADEPSWQDLADALWLARQLAPPASGADGGAPAPPDGRPPPPLGPPPQAVAGPEPHGGRAGPEEPYRDGFGPSPTSHHGLTLPGRDGSAGGIAVRVPTPPALPHELALRRALRPLGRHSRAAGHWGRERLEWELDEEATVDRAAATGFRLPVLRPAPTRWLDVALVVEDSVSMRVWDRSVQEFRAVLQTVGTFRTVQDWTLLSEESRSRGVVLRRGMPTSSSLPEDRSPGELVDPTGRRIVLVVSDCIGPAWSDGTLTQLLRLWGRSGPVAVVQPLPRRLWERTRPTVQHVRLLAPQAGTANARLVATSPRGCGQKVAGMPVPLLMLDPRSLGPWASLTSGESRELDALAILVDDAAPAGRPAADARPEPSAAELVNGFRAFASPAAWRLAMYLTAVPLSQPVMRMVHQVMIPDPQPAQLAEVMVGGLLMRAEDFDGARGDDVRFEFRPGVRELMMPGLNLHTARRLLQLMTDYIAEHHGATVDFQAVLDGDDLAVAGLAQHPPFARASARLLRLLGVYTAVAQRLESAYAPTDAPQRALPLTAPQVIGRHPARPARAFGREALVKDLHTALTSNGPSPQVLVGPEGAGATAAALEYVHTHGGESDVVVWLTAGTPAVGGRDLARLADTVAQRARAGCGTVWLLVLDGAMSADQLPELPAGRGQVLITSTSHDWPEGYTVHRLPAPGRGTGIRIARRHAPALTPSQARRLAERLDDSPLALELAAAYLSVTGESADAYLERLGEPRTGPDGPAAADVACGISLDHVLRTTPQARDMLHRLGVLAPGPVPVALLTPGAAAVADETLAALDRHGLLHTQETDDGIVFVHPVVRRACRDRMTDVDDAVARRAVRARMADRYGGEDPDEPSSWPRFAELTAHLEPAGVFGERDPHMRDLVQRHLRHLHACGDSAGCRALGALALRRLEDRSGHDDPAVDELDDLLKALLSETAAPPEPGTR
ncbi:SAV_2336 N-terminal domain-related protein [Streptomyces sp. enrichment culture]|uniref:SAV_2336 N-terminal domain-related protein n=1 Tax=Streptomyces sp. enrichment culture TaxID=1795815 RepID=UPI003F559265